VPVGAIVGRLKSATRKRLPEKRVFWKGLASRVVHRPPRGSRLKSDLVVDRLPQTLLTPEVALRRFHPNVTEKELNLLKLSTCPVT
jgi:hypothetical protein